MKTSIVILCYNNYEDTINCIESIEKYNTADIKYVIVDNGSDNSCCQRLADYIGKQYDGRNIIVSENNNPLGFLPYITLVLNSKNHGYAEGNNRGLKFIYNDREIDDILILNNDVLFVDDIIPMMQKSRNALKEYAIVSPILYKKDLKGIDYNCARRNAKNWDIILTYLFCDCNIFHILSDFEKDRKLLLKDSKLLLKNAVEIELPSGSCMLMKKSLCQEIGGFDPGTFLYYEENILYKKIARIHLKNYLLPQCKCIHLGASTMKKNSNIKIMKYGMKSASYYLHTYGEMTFLQKMFLSIALQIYTLKINLYVRLKNVAKIILGYK